MSKETAQGERCACGQLIAHMEFHIPHCEPAQARHTALAILRTKGNKAAAEFMVDRTLKKLRQSDKNRPKAKR